MTTHQMNWIVTLISMTKTTLSTIHIPVLTNGTVTKIRNTSCKGYSLKGLKCATTLNWKEVFCTFILCKQTLRGLKSPATPHHFTTMQRSYNKDKSISNNNTTNDVELNDTNRETIALLFHLATY